MIKLIGVEKKLGGQPVLQGIDLSIVGHAFERRPETVRDALSGCSAVRLALGLRERGVPVAGEVAHEGPRGGATG